MDKDFRGLIAEGVAALQARDPARAADLLREAAQIAPAGEMAWVALGNAELALRRHDAAEAAMERQLDIAPRDVGALLIKGWLREQAGDARAATSFYRAAINQLAVNGAVPPALAQLHGHALAYCESSEGDFADYLTAAVGTALSPTMTEAVELLTGKRTLYLQQPSVFYYPGLAQQRFFDPAGFPWLEGMLAHLPAMKQELAAVLADGAAGFSPYVHRKQHRPAPNSPLLDSPAWTAFHFWQDGRQVEANAAQCPATMAALAYAPMPVIEGRSPNAHWSRLLPGAHIAAHTGMLNTRLICHIPILTAPQCWLRVGSEVREWRDGVPLVFDDSIDHEAKNDGPNERVVLLFEIWRPEIPEEDRAAVARIFQAIGQYE